MFDPLPSPSPIASDLQVDVAGEIAALRPRIVAYVTSLVPHALEEVEDVVQATCVILWEKRDEFSPGTDFNAWAFRTAYFQALALRRDLSRNKVAVFSDQMLQRLAGPAEDTSVQVDRRIMALRHCVAALPRADQQLIALKYAGQVAMVEQARQLGVPPGRLQKSLSRLRLALKRCIENRLKLP